MLHPRSLPGRVRSSLGLLALLALLGLALAPALAAYGPPFPSPTNGQHVYDTAGVLSKTDIDLAEQNISAIKAATGAEVAVYTQLVPEPWDNATTASEARALMDQWGVGHKGIDDGVVIMIDIYQGNTCHGQVYLYGGAGYIAAYASADDLQAIYNTTMLPHLAGCDVPDAVTAATARIAALTTPAHAAELQGARQLNAVLGLIVAPLILILLVGGALLRWRLVGKDPVYLDDPSILMPAPPPGLTPAAGAAMRQGSADRRTMTSASLDLAVRDLVSFKAELPAAFTDRPGLGIYTGTAVTGDPAEQARMTLARSRPMDPGTQYLSEQMSQASGSAAYLPPDRITELVSAVSGFGSRLEGYLVTQGWYRSAPSGAATKWIIAAVALFLLAIVTFIIGWVLPASGIVLIGVSLGVSAVALGFIGNAMPARTKAGAVIVAMLEAYRRTLQKTMAMSRSMNDVPAQAAIPLIESPDDAVAWGVALGLNEDVEALLARSAETHMAGDPGVYLPAWYLPATVIGGTGGRFDGPGGLAPGLMSSSPIPDFGGMTAALGTIGTPPAPPPGSGGGGFSGGFGGGGGGGGGGGF